MSHKTYKYPRSAIHWRSRQHAAADRLKPGQQALVVPASAGPAGATKYSPPTGPMTVRDVDKKPITNQSLRDIFMSPGALEIKRRTPAFL